MSLAAVLGLAAPVKAQQAETTANAPAALRCEYLKNPLGIDETEPRLSWQIRSAGSGLRGQCQTAWQVLVATTPELLELDQGDRWDSGKVESDQSIHITYAGRLLASEQFCWWKVRIWDEAGRVSPWSETAHWSMGLLAPDDWRGEWIGMDGGVESRERFPGGSWIWHPQGDALAGLPAETRYFRRTFELPADGRLFRACIYLLPAGKFVLWVNGEKAVDGVGFPFGTETDVTRLLRPGTNVLALEVAHDPGEKPSKPAGVLLEARMEFLNREPLIVCSDAAWRSTDKEEAGWKTGMCNDGAWVAVRPLGPAGIAPWGDVNEDEHRRLPARMLRREFAATRTLKRATASVCGLGFFELSINGHKVGDDLMMNPALSCYDKHAMVMTFDVTGHVRDGANAIGVLLGNGRFFAPRILTPTATKTFGFPKLLFQLRLDYADGSTETVVSDGAWKITDQGPIRANNEFDGEEYDARREQDGWDAPGFDDSSWRPAQLVADPGGKLIAQMFEPMRVTETLKPVEITEPKPGMFLVDFGQNLYGVVRLKVEGPRGTRVQMRTSFSKTPESTIKMEDNRSAWSTDVYTLRGNGHEVWSPRFRGQGTRFVEVTGFPVKPTLENFELLAVQTGLEKTGGFECSNGLLNQIYANVVRSTRMQERSVPLDPDRDERQAWLGHPAKTSESEAHVFNVAAFYKSFMGEIRVDQREDGDISDAGSVWPFYSADGIWPSVITILPDWFHGFYGDRRILEENYETMSRWLKLLEQKNLQADFTISTGFYGDWVDAASMDEGTTDSGGTSRPLMYSAYFFHNCRILARVAERLGHAADAAQYSALAEKVRAGFLARFYDPVKKKFESETQCSYILPLAFGLVPPEDHAAVVANLVEDIMVKHRGHLSVGLTGMQWFMQALTDAGHPEVAYHVATRTTRPSWGYMISKGGTSMWERWDQDTRDPGMNGESQLILSGNLGAWFYQTLGGINCDPECPAFKHIILRPRPVGDLKWVKTSFKSLHGTIRSEWNIEGDTFHWQITVPPNTTATVHIPTRDAASVRENGEPAKDRAGIQFLRTTETAAIYQIGSGTYDFTASKPAIARLP